MTGELQTAISEKAMRKDKVKEFYGHADEYCRCISRNVITTDKVPTLMRLLMTLYISAMALPETEQETVKSSSDTVEAIPFRIDEQVPTTYWEVFNPYVYEDPVCGDLADDLSDIAADLKAGMNEYETGRIGSAVFEWRFGLRNHWGQHIVNALRALHSVRTQ